MFGGFMETYKIVIAYIEMAVDIIKVFSGYKSLFVRLGYIYRCIV